MSRTVSALPPYRLVIMGQYSYKTKHVVSRSSSSSSYTFQFVGGAADAFRYSVRESRTTSRKVYSADVLKHRVRGAEGQVWTNLASWTDGRVDAVDFGRSRRARRKDAGQKQCAAYRGRDGHWHNHHHQHTHTHHHHHHYEDHRRPRHVDDEHRYPDDEDLDGVTARLSRSLHIGSSPPSTRATSSRSRPRPRLRSPSPSRSLFPPVQQKDDPDPPPPYSQLSERPGGCGSDRLSCRKERERERERERPHPVRDDRGVAEAPPPFPPSPSPPPSSPPAAAWSRSTSTLFAPSQVRWPEREEGEKKAGGDVRARDREGYGGGGGGSGSSRDRDRDRGDARSASYLVPGASAGTNLGQCPYLRRLHGSAA